MASSSTFAADSLLDVPFGLVDFIEVLQGGRLNSEIWYTFLNLGYRVLPVAGADFPYFGPTLPGVERTYVRLDGPFSADAWFAAFREGHAYVTNGPFLELAVNGRQMGDELRVARGTRLQIEAAASLNPEFDQLDRLDLVVLGDVAATETADGADEVALNHALTADRSMWIAAHAWGERRDPRDMIVAHSAPIYVVVDDEPTWKREAVPELIAYQRAQLRELLSAPIDPQQDLETWETSTTLVERWRQQRSQLVPRVDEADLRYQELLERFRQSVSRRKRGPAVTRSTGEWPAETEEEITDVFGNDPQVGRGRRVSRGLAGGGVWAQQAADVGPQAGLTARGIVGYADQLSVAPGETIRFMVSSELPTYRAEIVRLIHGDANPNGPGVKETLITTPANGDYPGRHQDLPLGSYVTVPDAAALRLAGSFTIAAWVAPTRPGLVGEDGVPGAQGVVTKWAPNRGYGLMIDDGGRLALLAGWGRWPGGEGGSGAGVACLGAGDPGRGAAAPAWCADAVVLRGGELRRDERGGDAISDAAR